MDGWREADVGFWRSQRWQRLEWSYRDGYRHNRCTLEPTFDAQNLLVVIVIVHCWCPDHHPTLFLDVPHPSVCSFHTLLPQHPFPGSSQGSATEDDCPRPRHHRPHCLLGHPCRGPFRLRWRLLQEDGGRCLIPRHNTHYWGVRKSCTVRIGTDLGVEGAG